MHKSFCMSVKLSASSYGKSAVRVKKLIKHADRHEVVEMNVSVLCRGDFEEAHVTGNNTQVLPTDTQKNTIYALAKDHPLDTIESFGLALANHFLSRNEQFVSITVAIEQLLWEPILIDGKPQSFACRRADSERYTTLIDHSRAYTRVKSGISELNILKTTKSGFSAFKVDEFTTLKDTDDRMLETLLTATWTYESDTQDFAGIRASILKSLLSTFAEHDSLSVQHTLYAMGKVVLDIHPTVRRIDLDMPNKHNLLFNFEPFQMQNDNEIFIVTDEPYGVIKGRLERGE